MEPSTCQILAVDDTSANLEVLVKCLTAFNYNVAVAVDGERALKRLQTYQPNLILLDIQMPGIDGFETCRRIKENPAWASIPIIFITALNDIDSVAKGLSLGAVDYINKPFHEVELLARVKTHLSLQQMNQQLEQLVAERTRALEMTMAQLEDSQVQIVQSEKMATLGNLVAGVAHEINNPLGFLDGSIVNIKDYVKDLLAYIKIYQQEAPPTNVVEELAEEIDLEFLQDDLPKILESMTGATSRLKGISKGLRIFSRADIKHKVYTNLHEGLDGTLLLLKYRIKANPHRPAIAVTKNYGSLPEISCFPSQLNQVFMNILANAIDMFDEMAEQSDSATRLNHPQEISIQTSISLDQDAIEICIADNGKGMPEDIRSKVFDRSFTTKGVGKGTGLGLAIAYQIVTETHNGNLTVESTLGQGSKFWIRLPLASVEVGERKELDIPKMSECFSRSGHSLKIPV